MRRLIVNADDLGYTEGIDRGILEAHERGIVTSASLMVDRPAAVHGAEVARRAPHLSVGLHAVLDSRGELTVPPERCEKELERQLAHFHELVGRPPTHVDSHHHVHRDSRLVDVFEALGERHALPLRDRTVRHCGLFYGSKAIGVERLLELLEGLDDGDTELACHPGYADGLHSRYTQEREQEVRTLTDPRVRTRLGELDIELIGWRNVAC
jgi:chitin disaccharide deacetylase